MGFANLLTSNTAVVLSDTQQNIKEKSSVSEWRFDFYILLSL